jgi:hypothetical protein
LLGLITSHNFDIGIVQVDDMLSAGLSFGSGGGGSGFFSGGRLHGFQIFVTDDYVFDLFLD